VKSVDRGNGLDSLLRETRRTLTRYGIRLRKRWGQNLLVDEGILEKIVEAANLKEGDTVLEIGPGIGTLTKRLARKAEKVITVEIDSLLVKLLKEELKEYNNIEIIEADILNLDLSSLFTSYQLPVTKIKVVTNLPYYITSPLLLHLLEEKERIASMVIMLQREVGERILGRPGGKEYGLLSIAIQYHTEPEFITYVPKASFSPQPKVEGVVLRLIVLRDSRVKIRDEGLFFKIVRAAFGKRRKTLLNALSMGGLGLKKEEINSFLLEAGIDPKRRAETLSLEDFARLSNLFANI
jgi:16S rRNA (adenine1518-N6/adenine1519-N6)-dimethyltransferase